MLSAQGGRRQVAPVAAFWSSESEPADASSSKARERRLALSEFIVDREFGVIFDDDAY